MLTKNFKSCLAICLVNAGTRYRGIAPVKTVSGVTKYIKNIDSNWPISDIYSPQINASYYNQGLYFGSGITPSTEDDYTIENRITSGIVVSNIVDGYQCVDQQGRPQSICRLTVTNNGDNNIVIGEIGMFVRCSLTTEYDTNNGSSSEAVMVDRTVLDTPVTLAPGEATIITYKRTVGI